ncbi:MAG: histidinol-phosphate aminotransferase family protein [Acidobacteria bacterium]|nr:histidinol-phosphate aminotransferase family protein [Acidobacteriota bacterium]
MSVIQGYPSPGEGLRLHLNENTGGCSPRVLEAIRRVQQADVSTYPSYRDAVVACARHFGVDPDWVLLTNGLDEGILMAAVGHIARARIHDAETIVPLPAFDPYPNSTAAVGATAVRVPPGRDYAFPTEAVLAAITPRTRLIFLNTPNNPTGQLIAVEDLVRIGEAAPHAIVLIDEAYIECGGTTFLPQLPRHPNVLVGRTFSKAYGLAGMRIGIVIGQPPALDPVRAVTLPFNINGVALAAMHAALADSEFLPRYAAHVRESRERLYGALRRLGLPYWESAANFVMVRVGEAAPFIDALAARKVHVRDRSTDPTTPGCIRITTGILEHTAAAIDALESVMALRQGSGQAARGAR